MGSARWVFFEGDATHFQRDCNASKNTCKQMSGKGNQSKSWSMSEPSSQAKEKVKIIKGKPKDCPKEPRVRTKVSKAHAMAKCWKRDRLMLLTRRGFTRN